MRADNVADDSVMCARGSVLDVEQEPWREDLQNRGLRVSRVNIEYM